MTFSHIFVASLIFAAQSLCGEGRSPSVQMSDLTSQALALFNSGHYDNALARYDQALEIAVASADVRSQVACHVYSSSVYIERGYYGTAKDSLKRASGLLGSVDNLEFDVLISYYNNLAVLHLVDGELSRASLALDNAYAMIGSRTEPTSPDLLRRTQSNMAALQLRRGDLPASESAYRNVLAGYGTKSGAYPPDAFRVLVSFSTVLCLRHKWIEAETVLQQAIATNELSTSVTRADLRAVYEQYATVLSKLRRLRDAALYRRKAEQLPEPERHVGQLTIDASDMDLKSASVPTVITK